MTFESQYKLDDGTSVVMDCFPVRKIFKRGYQSAGHWVEVQKSPKQKDFQAVLGPKPPTQKVLAAPSPVSKPHVAQIPKPVKEKVLDGNYLMLLHHVDNQSDLCVVNINDQDLNAVNGEDFYLFDNVAYINAAANHLPFEPFCLFPALRELDLSANGLRNLLVRPQDFPHLEVLNISYNNVSKEDILALGLLPHLKVLHLTGNDLDSLPPDLATPYHPVDRLEEPLPRFPVLEVLMLDENRFSDPCVFSSLAGLHRLKYLNLDENNFTGVPYLQQMELFEKMESTPLCQSAISQIKQPVKCLSLKSAETSLFHSDVEVERRLREKVVERVGVGESVAEGERVWVGERMEEGERVGVGERVEEGERVGVGERVEEGEMVSVGERVEERERVQEGERVGVGKRVEEGEMVRVGERVEEGKMGERMEEVERVEEEERVGHRVEEGKRVEEEERVGESGEVQQKMENVEKGQSVEQKEVKEKKEEVKDDQEMEDDEALEDEDEEMEKAVINSLLRPESSNSSFGETSTAMEGQEFMDQFLENPEAKQKCFPEATSEFLPPFSGLIHLSLTKNKIADDEELLAVCLFPALRKLTIYKNPITLSTGPKPHLVISMLRDRLGLDLVTHEPRPQDRTPVFKVFNTKRKVDTYIPKVPRQALMLETAKRLLGLNSAGPGETQSGEAEPRTTGKAGDSCTELMAVSQEDCREKGSIPESVTRTPERQHQESVEGFFMTQVDDMTLNSEAEVGLGEKQTTEPSVTTNLPEKYRGYEELLDAATDPYFVEPVGIQQNVQQLEWYLRKLQPYPDPFGHVNLQQRRYIPKQRKFQKLPESTPHKSKADKMEEILKRMKEQRAMMVVPLAHVLRGKGVTRQEYDEAVALLRDLQLKYMELRGRLAANVNRLYEQCKDLRSEQPEQDTLSASSSRMDF